MGFYDTANLYPDSSIGYLVKVCNQLGMAHLDRAFADEGLSAVHWSALISIHFGRAPTCAALARDLAHDKGAMTRMIDTLEQKGLVRRLRNDDDRRVIQLSLTPEGEAATLRCRDRVIACWNEWLTGWTHDEITTKKSSLFQSSLRYWGTESFLRA